LQILRRTIGELIVIVALRYGWAWLALACMDSAKAQDTGHLPNWIGFGAASRTRFERPSGLAFVPGNSDTYLLSGLRLTITAEPAAWLRVFVEGQDSRSAGAGPGRPNFTNSFDLRQVYALLGSDADAGWGLKVGRQELVIGSERIVGVNHWSNFPRSWQRGRTGSERLRKFQGFAQLRLRFSGVWSQPRTFAELALASGDKSPGDDVVQTFELLYPRAHPIFGNTDQLGGRNLRHLRAGAELAPTSGLNALADFQYFWLDSTRDGLYAANGRAIVVPQPGAFCREPSAPKSTCS